MPASEVVAIPGVVLRRSESGMALRFRSLTGVTVWLPGSLIEVKRERGEVDQQYRAAYGRQYP